MSASCRADRLGESQYRSLTNKHRRSDNADAFMGYLGDEWEAYLDSMASSGTWGDELTLVGRGHCGFLSLAHGGSLRV